MHTKVEDFLVECRELIDKRQIDLFLNDPENRATMEMLAYTPRAMTQEIRDIEPKDLFKGPVEDYDRSHTGHVWIFKKPIKGILIYIKLKIRVRGGKEVFVMSFHPDR